MTLPEPINTFALTLPSPADHAGDGQRARYRITPSDEITYAATGLRLLPDVMEYDVKAGESRVVDLPHPLQPGMIDPNGADILDWHYVVTMAVLTAGRWTDRPGRRIVQPAAGVTAVDVALIPDQEPARRSETVTPVDRALTARDDAERAAERSRDYANDADLSAGRAAGYVTDAGTQADRADQQRRAAELAADDAGVERVGAGEERAAAQLARTGAEAARDIALAGQFAGANLQTGTNLNTVTTPGVYRQITATDLRALNYPNQSSLGVLRVYTTTNTVLQEFTVTTNGPQAARGFYVRRLIVSSGTWTSWSFVAAQRVDQTAGRAVYTWDDINNRDQLIYGDTGWRSIPDLLQPGYSLATDGVAADIRIRRVGSTVELLMGRVVQAAGAGVNMLAIPAGFRPSDWIGWDWTTNPSGTPALARYYATTTGFLRAENTVPLLARGGLYQRASWPTSEAWPTALPGTPFGGIPNA